MLLFFFQKVKRGKKKMLGKHGVARLSANIPSNSLRNTLFLFWEIFILEPKLWGTGHFGTGNRGTGNRFPGTIRGEPGNRFPGTGSLVPVWFPLWFPVTGYWVLGTGYCTTV